MQKLHQNNGRQSGFSLLELLLVVGVGSIFIIAAISTYKLVNQQQMVNEASEMIITLKSEIDNHFKKEASFNVGQAGDVDLLPLLKEAKVLPIGSSNNVDNPVNPWGGSMTVTGAADHYDIGFEGLPTEGCAPLLGGLTASLKQRGDFVLVVANGTEIEDSELTVQDATGFCNQSGNNNDLTWRFR